VDHGTILAELVRLAGRIGVSVRAEPFDLKVIEGKGGLCWLRGEPIVVMDAGLPVVDKIGVMARALAAFDLEAIYVPPLLRAKIGRTR
jgi:hypothetical protein